MRRRADDAVDPLDLLLDTVCNLFAVIIFIAVLAAIMVEPVRDGPDGVGTGGGVLDLEPATRVLIEVPDPSLAEADLSIESMRLELEQRLASIQMLEELDSKLDAETADLASFVATLQRDAEAIERQVRDRSAAATVPMRTPRRDTQRDAMPVAMYLWRDRLFLAHDFRGWAGERDPSQAWLKYMGEERLDPRVVRRGSSSVRDAPDGTRRYRIDLRSDGGIPAASPEALRGDRQWLEGVGGLIPGVHTVYLSVRQDAFAAFGVVRSELARLGIGYDVFIEPGHDGVFETVWVTGLPTTQ